jgi:hypothetical protein
MVPDDVIGRSGSSAQCGKLFAHQAPGQTLVDVDFVGVQLG